MMYILVLLDDTVIISNVLFIFNDTSMEKV